MKLGIKDFRDQLSAITDRGEPVVVTNHGREVATYVPRRPIDIERARTAAEDIRNWQKALREKGVDLDAVLAGMGLDPWGVPLDDAGR